MRRCPPVAAVAAIIVALLALASCGSDSGSQGARAVPPASTAEPGVGCRRFQGSKEGRVAERPKAPMSMLVAASAGAEGCLDVVVFDFRSVGDGSPPGYDVAYYDPSVAPFLDGDPPRPIAVPGGAFLVVRIGPAASVDVTRPDRPPTYLGNLFLSIAEQHHLVMVRKLPDAPSAGGQIVWVISLDEERPFAVDSSAYPTRVAVLIG